MSATANKGWLSWCAIARFYFISIAPLGNFSAYVLDYYVLNTAKANLSLFLPFYAEACNEFAVPISAS